MSPINTYQAVTYDDSYFPPLNVNLFVTILDLINMLCERDMQEIAADVDWFGRMMNVCFDKLDKCPPLKDFNL